VVTEGGAIPVGWIPTVAVDPLNSAAIQAYWNAGPRAVASAEYSLTYYSSAPLVPDEPGSKPPAVQWKAVPGTTNAFQLTGAGAALGVRSVG
jgi:hypothetical protein